MHEPADIAIVGASAAGLMAGIWAGREAGRLGRPVRVVAFDGAARIGVKILVSGGGRCNVTNAGADARAYSGGSRNAIRAVLRRFDCGRTAAFFRECGVELREEPGGKLFPTSDDAHTVLTALTNAARAVGLEIVLPARVETVGRDGEGFVVGGDWGSVRARRLILATGGMAMPRSGSDGGGYALARSLGHTITEHVFPALAPLVLESGCPLRDLSGVAVTARLTLHGATGKRLVGFTDSVLCTHFGLSGPGAMDMSRHYTAARFADSGASLSACWLPGIDRACAERELRALGTRGVGSWAGGRLPERLARALCAIAGVDRATTGAHLARDARARLLEACFEMRLPVVGDRGFRHAEATAGGVPLGEITVSSMSSRVCEGLYLCGEICDVDGRIGGYNFQWAWSSGYVAGIAAVNSLPEESG